VELVQGWALLQRAEISLMTGNFREALDLLKSASAVEKALGQPDKLWLHGLLAAAFSRLGETQKALASARQAMTLARQSLPTSFFVLEGYSGMAEAFITYHKAHPSEPGIRKLAKRALKAFDGYAGSFPIGRPRLQYWRGILAFHHGRPASAVRVWNKGLKQAENLRMVYEADRLRNAALNGDPD
jgi:tetratricopeptide (TPR) repeat protein